MNSWKKMLKQETEKSVRNLKMSQEVRNASLPRKEKTEQTERKDGNFKSFFTVKRLAAFAAAFVALCIAVIPCAIAINNAAENGKRCEVLLEVNPSVLFVTDKNGKITDVKSMNSDADVILCDDETVERICGLPLGEGAEVFLDRAARLGYIDLDSKNNAVKLSSDKAFDFVDDCAEGLKKYFCEKGVYSVVLSETVEIGEFAEKLGISASDEKEMTAKASGLSKLYGERTDDISKAHKDNVMGGLYEIVISRVSDIIDGAELIFRMKIVNFEIKAHILNLGNDYWDIKDKDVSDYLILSSLKDRMEELIEEYSVLTGGKCQMKTRWELETAMSDYLSLLGDICSDADCGEDDELTIERVVGELTAYFDDLNLDKFCSDESKLLAVLDKTDIDTFGYVNLTNEPSTLKEYEKDLKQVLSARAVELEKTYKSSYETQRNALSSAEYNSYLEEIAEKYGSLSAFVAQKNKK